jgi:hypothetical protein
MKIDFLGELDRIGNGVAAKLFWGVVTSMSTVVSTANDSILGLMVGERIAYKISLRM